MRKLRLKTVVGNLALVHRNIRISGASGACAFPGGEISLTGDFARSVFQRYGYDSGRWHRPEYIFRILRFLQNTFSEYHHLSYVINRHIRKSLIVRPGFNLQRFFIQPGFMLNQTNRIETPQGEVINISGEAIKKIISGETIKKIVQSNGSVKLLTVHGAEKKLLRLTHTQNIVQRVTRRNVRTEQNTIQQNTRRIFASLDPEYLKQAPFVTQERRKPVETITHDVGVQEQQYNGLQQPANLAFTSGQKSDSREINSVNIDCLTDKIVRAIDQRIIAQRERLGRM